MTVGITQLYPTLERETMVATNEYAQDAKVLAYQWVDPVGIPPAPMRYLRKVSWWRGGGWELYEEASQRWVVLEGGDWLVSERLGWRRVSARLFPLQWSPAEPPSWTEAIGSAEFDPRAYLNELETIALAVLKAVDPHPYAVVGYTPDGCGLALVTLGGIWVLDLPQPHLEPETRVAMLTAQVIDAWETATGRKEAVPDDA